jgi:hypothetical protein
MLQSVGGSIGRSIVVVSGKCAGPLHVSRHNNFYQWNELRQMVVITAVWRAVAEKPDRPILIHP